MAWLWLVLFILALTLAWFLRTTRMVGGGVDWPSVGVSAIVDEEGGHANYAKGVNSSSIFNLGSISKSFTAIVLAQLVEEGKLKWDDPADKYLKDWKIDSDDVSIEHLAGHTSGLHKHDSGVSGYPLDAERPLPSLDDILRGTPRLFEAPMQEWPEITKNRLDDDNVIRLVKKPGTEWQYSTANYVVLQIIIENVEGKSFADVAEKRILKPLKMKSATFRSDDIHPDREKNLLTPHFKDDKTIQHYHYVNTAGSVLYATMADMILFCQALIKQDGTLLKPKSWKKLTTPGINKDYGLGFMLDHGIGHRGTNWGWKAHYRVFPKEKRAAIYLSNYQGYDYIPWLDQQS